MLAGEMKLFVLLAAATLILTQSRAKSVSGHQEKHSTTSAKGGYVSANSLYSADNSFNRDKYTRHAIKRDAPQAGDLDDASEDPVGQTTTTTEPSYPGYHSSQHIMVIPPRSAGRRQRAIENYGTQNEIGTADVKVRNDTFGDNAYDNVLTGLYVWRLLGNLKQTERYDLFHYYNRPVDMRAEIDIPAAQVDVCREANQSLCLEGHMPLCTTEDVVYCVVKIHEAVDCSSRHSGQRCAKTPVPCMSGEGEDAACRDTLLIPCLATVSVDMRMIGVTIRYCGVTYSTRKTQGMKGSLDKGSPYQTLNAF